MASVHPREDSIIEQLGYEGSRVFTVERKSEDTFEITEACDMYFSKTLTRLELMLLGMELIELALGKRTEQ